MTKPRYRLTAAGDMVRVGDGFQNLVANLGTDRDKAAASGYVRDAARPWGGAECDHPSV